MTFAYIFFSYIFLLFAPLYFLIRNLNGIEIFARIPERFGFSRKGSKNPTIWFHAASVGETNSILPLIRKILKNKKNHDILVTSCTVTSANLIINKLPQEIQNNKVTHHFLPIDCPLTVKIFLKKWNFEKIFWVESEIWPNILKEAAKICEISLINGRISNRSFKRWNKFPNLAEEILKNFSEIISQTKEYQERFSILSNNKTSLLENLKFSAIAEFLEDKNKFEQEILELKQQFKNRPIIIFASTHNGEEEFALKSLSKLENNPLIIIAPREISRTKNLISMFANSELKNKNISLSSQAIKENSDIILIDEIGKLAIFYELSQIAFMGGSLIQHGGQNPLEPASLGNAIISGPNYFNFQEIYDNLIKENAAKIIHNQKELIDHLNILLSNQSKQKEFSKNAKIFSHSKMKILDIYFNHLFKEEN